MNIFELSASLILDKKNYEEGLNQAENQANKSGSKISGVLGASAKVAGAGIAAISAATVGATTAIVNGAGKVAEYGDNIDKMSQKMGISAQAYQEWDAIMQHSGTSIDSMSRGMQTLQKNAVNSAEKFEALGISQEQLANMSTEELFSATITGLQNMGEGAERTALASELLGGSAKELGALLNTSAEDTEAMRQKVHELGGVMSDEAVKAAAAYQDSLQDMQTGFESLKRNLLADFMPSLTTVMNGLTDIFSGNYDEGLDKLSDSITKVVNEISSKLPKIMEVGGKIIETLAIAIIDNLPALIKAAVPIITELATGLIENLPKIIEAAVMLITTLAQGLVDALPKLIPAIVETITEIVEMLTEPDTLVQLIMAAVQIMMAIAEGLIQAIPILIKAVPQIIGNLIEAIVRLFPLVLETGVQMLTKFGEGIKQYVPQLILQMLNGLGLAIKHLLEMGKKWVNALKDGIKSLDPIAWGRDLIENFISGLKEKWEKLKSTVSNIAGSIKALLGFSEPEKGPLSNFHTYAPDMMDLFMKGIKDNEGALKDTVEEAFDFKDLIMPNSDMTTGYIAKSNNGIVGGDTTVTLNIYGAQGQDVRELADIISERINATTNRQLVAVGMA